MARVSHQTKIVLQAFLDHPEEEAYGFALAQYTGLKVGTLYPVLQRLLENKWLTARWEEIDEAAAGRRRRRYFALTSLGEARARALVRDQTTGLRHLTPGWSSELPAARAAHDHGRAGGASSRTRGSTAERTNGAGRDFAKWVCWCASWTVAVAMPPSG